jgi:hypothetical protein
VSQFFQPSGRDTAAHARTTPVYQHRFASNIHCYTIWFQNQDTYLPPSPHQLSVTKSLQSTCLLATPVLQHIIFAIQMTSHPISTPFPALSIHPTPSNSLCPFHFNPVLTSCENNSHLWPGYSSQMAHGCTWFVNSSWLSWARVTPNICQSCPATDILQQPKPMTPGYLMICNVWLWHLNSPVVTSISHCTG